MYVRTLYLLISFLFVDEAMLTTEASAQEFGFANENLTPTGISGTGQQDETLQAAVARNSRLWGVMWGERNDSPCHLQLWYERLETGARSGRVEWRDCSDKANRRMSTERSRRNVSVPEGIFITGLQACVNRNKVKGIRLSAEHGACVLGEDVMLNFKASERRDFRQGNSDQALRVDTPSILISCDDPRAVHHPAMWQVNCKKNDWTNQVNCPLGHVATGLQVSTRAGSGGKQIVQGIGMMCRELVRLGD